MELGQIVLYHPPGGQSYFGRELSAIVTEVHAESVNLCIFDPYGNPIQNPPQNIPTEKNEFNGGYCSPVRLEVPNTALRSTMPNAMPNTMPNMPNAMPNAMDVEGIGPQMGGVPNIPFDKSELPAGARMVEHRPATPEEIEAAKAGIVESGQMKSPKKPVKKPVRKPKSPRKPKSGY